MSPPSTSAATDTPVTRWAAKSERGLPPLGPDSRRAITALLRERAHRLPRLLSPRLAAAARIFPALLHASFSQRPLDGDAPGVAGLRYRPRWSALSRYFGLPPPFRAQRGTCLVEAVVAWPSTVGLEVIALVPAGLSREQLRSIQERLDGAQRIVSGPGAPIRTGLFDPSRLARERETCHRVLAFGALLAGNLSSPYWTVFENEREPLPALLTSSLAAAAPVPLATIALTLMTREPCPSALSATLALLARGTTPRSIADPESFCLAWAGLTPDLTPLLEDARSLSRNMSGPFATEDLSQFIRRGRALAVACARAIRASRLGRIDRFSQRLWREALGPGMPRLLLPALSVRLAAEAAAGRLHLEPVRAGRCFEVVLADGTSISRGANSVQARVRALGLVAAAEATRPGASTSYDLVSSNGLFAGLDPTWRELGQRLARPRDQATLLLMVVAGGGTRPGPPMDLLNRGPQRSLEFDGALSVLLAPGRRPAGRMLGPEEVVRMVLRRAPAGASLETIATHTSGRPVAARLSQIATLLRDPSVPGPIAIEAGGRVFLPEERLTREFALNRFARRPRVFTPDPDAPDISISTGERQGLRYKPSGVVQCRVTPIDGRTAALLYGDGAGVHLREEVPIAELEGLLDDQREILRMADPPAVLMVRLSDGLEQVVRRVGPPGTRVGVTVRGSLPFPEVEIAGERFGGKAPLGWRAAAEALLSQWPASGDGIVSVRRVLPSADGARLQPLLALYVSAAVRRRLRTHLREALSSYRKAATSRREG